MFETGLIIWGFGLLGILIKSWHLLELLFCIEIMLSGIFLVFIAIALEMDDLAGIIFALIILVIAAIESCIGLLILVKYHRLTKTVQSYYLHVIKG